MKKLLANSALVAALVGAIITVLGAFGVSVSSNQNTAIVAAVSALLALVGAWFSPSVQSFGVKA